MILVTGATGFLGAHLLYDLIAQGENVRALYRTEESKKAVEALFKYKSSTNAFVKADLFTKIRWQQADITDVTALSEAFVGITHVYHCAAVVSFDPSHFKKMQKVNVEGTANMVNLSLSHGVKKFCHVSSVASLGKTENGRPTTEETQWAPAKDKSAYSITKFASEMEVWRGTQEGLTAVIVNPSIIIGEGFYNTGSGLFFKEIEHGMRFTVPGANSFTDVLDVARAMILLMKSDVAGQRFILAGTNTAFDTFFGMIARDIHTSPPAKMAKSWQLNLGWRLDYATHLVFGTKRTLFRATAKASITHVEYDASKITEELDFKFIPLEDTLKRTVEHYKSQTNRGQR